MILISRGSVTRDNSKISAVDGTSFIDPSAADIFTKKRGCMLVYKDSAGKALIGYIKAAGTGETLSDELTHVGG